MTNQKLAWLLGLGGLAAVSSGCLPEEEGCTYSARVCDVTGEAGFTALAELGATIHEGETPPLIEGTYAAAPFVLESSNFNDGFAPGFAFTPIEITLYDQDLNEGTVKLDYVSTDGGEDGRGIGSVIVGEGSKFSIFARLEGMVTGVSTSMLVTISGEWTSTGIRTLEYGLIMADKGADPGNRALEVGQGRLIVDQDGFSPLL